MLSSLSEEASTRAKPLQPIESRLQLWFSFMGLEKDGGIHKLEDRLSVLERKRQELYEQLGFRPNSSYVVCTNTADLDAPLLSTPVVPYVDSKHDEKNEADDKSSPLHHPVPVDLYFTFFIE